MFDKSKLWAVGLLVAAFAAGVATGTATSSVFGWGRAGGDRGRGGDPERRSGSPPAGSFLKRLDRDLSLTPVQHDSVAAILKRYDEPMRELWRHGRQQLDSMRLEVRTEIGSVLNQEQRERYQVMNQRMDSLRAARERGGASREDR